MNTRSPGRTLALAFALVTCFACENAERDAPRAKARDLAEGEVARVGEEGVDGETVEAIARAQGTTLSVARDRAIRDALFAVEARARGREPKIAESALLAKQLIDERRRAVDGPVTDEELDALTKQHWLDFDRPEGFRTMHALVMLPKAPAGAPATPDSATWDRLEAIAKLFHDEAARVGERMKSEKLDDAAALAALKGAIAKVDAQGQSTRVEALDSVAADGRVLVNNGGNYSVEFSSVVAKLHDRGDVTPAFRSPFGIHVAVFLERTPPERTPPDEVRSLVHAEVLEARLKKEREAILAAGDAKVELPPNAAALLQIVTVSPASQGVAEGTP